MKILLIVLLSIILLAVAIFFYIKIKLRGILKEFFDTNKDVEEWEYSAIYDLYDYDLFKENNFHIEDVDDEYNPTFMVKFDYIEDYDKMKSVIEDCLSIIDETMENVFKAIEGKEEEYK